MKKTFRGSISLLLATIIWGSAFIAQSVGMDYIGPFTFQALRCGLAVLFLIPLIFLFDRDKKSYVRQWAQPGLWKTGIVCGIALFIAGGLQQVGIIYTTAGKAGFITAMYIVIVPFLGLFFRKVPPITAWISVVIATAGLYLLSCVGVSSINKGDLCLIGCAVAFAVQITLVDRLAGQLDGLRLNCIQSLVCAALSAVTMALTETVAMENILSCWLPLCYAGILSMGVAYSLQIIGQKYVEPTPASLIMSLESVFAAVFGWLLLKESLSGPELLGCLLVFAAVILSQIPVKKKA
ncbi:MAG: DMT family transporter [Oscillospiraceae bacterium]|nr:DMT family transporter [Oscillospiraceae bacterium]